MTEPVKSVTRVVQAINFIVASGEVKLDELAAELGVHKTSALRLLGTLKEEGWVVADDRHVYSVGPALIPLGQAAVSHLDLGSATELAADLRDITGETVHLAIPFGDRMLLVGRVDSPHALRVACEIGSLDALHTSSLGKAYLSTLSEDELEAQLGRLELMPATVNSIVDRNALEEEIRTTAARRYSIDREEGRLGVSCMGIALPVEHGFGVVCLSITGPSSRWNESIINRHADKVLAQVHLYAGAAAR